MRRCAYVKAAPRFAANKPRSLTTTDLAEESIMATRILTAVLFVCLTGLSAPEVAEAQGYHWNSGGYRNGGIVQPHFKSNPDGNPYNNLGSWGR
jgi:hypothetical protein